MSGTFSKCIISIALKGDLVEVSKNSIFFTLFLMGAGRGDAPNTHTSPIGNDRP